MKKAIFLVLALVALGYPLWAYDFSAVAPTGQTLYYNIVGNSAVVTYPGNRYWNSWLGYTQPTGVLTIPDSVTMNDTSDAVIVISIDGYAFKDCNGLTSVTIPSSVTSIGNYAFGGCSSLISVSIPNSVTSIGNFAFYNCSNLTSVSIPSSVTSIGFDAFSIIPLIYYQGTATGSPWGAMCVNGYMEDSLIYSDSTKTFVVACHRQATSITITSSVDSIGNSAFDNCGGLTSVTIPTSVTFIGTAAFMNCSGLTSITIPTSVTTLGSSAFYGCSSLTHVVYNARNCTLTTNSSYRPFQNNTSITSLVIGDSVQSIPSELMYGCSGLTTVTIGKSVSTIGDNVFKDCTSLRTLYYNARSCARFPNNYIAGNWTHPFANCDSLTTVVVGNGVRRVPYQFLYGKSSVTSVSLPNSIDTIGGRAFYGCSKLTSIVVPDSVSTIESEAFYCNRATSVVLGSSVRTIAYDAFHSDLLQTFTIKAIIPPSVGNGYIRRLTGIPSSCLLYYPCGSNYNYWSSGTFDYRYPSTAYTLTLSANDPQMGEVTYNCVDYTHVTLTATPAEGHHFLAWSDGSTENPRLVTLTQDTAITAQFLYFPAPQLCMVTVNDNHCQLYMQSYDFPDVERIIVGCERSEADVFDSIGTIDLNGDGSFTDSLSNPLTRTYRYRLTAVDSLGRQSLGSIHTTSHLSINRGMNGWNLIWTPYEGVNVLSCRIYRGTSPQMMEYLAAIPGTLTSYADPVADEDSLYYYQVSLITDADCLPDAKTVATVRTNIVTTHNPLTIPRVDGSLPRIYPNPATSEVTLEGYQGPVEIIDPHGRVILREEIATSHSTLHISHITAGIYFIRTGDIVQKFIKK